MTVLLLHPRGGAIMLPPGHFAVKCGCGMVGGCRQPDAPAGTPSSGTHLCTLCDRRVVKFSNPTKSNMMQRASAEEATLTCGQQRWELAGPGITRTQTHARALRMWDGTGVITAFKQAYAHGVPTL